MSRARSFSKLINKDNYATYSGSDSVTDISAVSLPQGTLSFRNRIINGDMRIDQRNAGASITPLNGQFSVDRLICIQSTSSKYSIQQNQNAGSVTPPTGFVNYVGITSLSTYSVATGDQFYVAQRIEANNFTDLAWGATNAKTVTLSFWVRSSLTGTFGGSIVNAPTFNYSYPFSYTISSADTWEYKTVTIEGPISGTWTTSGNGSVLQIAFGLGVGLSFSGTENTWASALRYAPTGATSVVGTSGATFYITGVQLEEGTVATTFEHRPYGIELALCQRYYQEYGYGKNGATDTLGFASGMWYSSTEVFVFPQLPVLMRSAPTITVPSVTDGYRFHKSGSYVNLSTLTYIGSWDGRSGIIGTLGTSGGTGGHATFLTMPVSGASIKFDAEL